MSNASCNYRLGKLNSVTHNVRTNQVVLQYGVGAMIDFPDQTLMTASTDFWRDDSLRDIHDERLEKLLKVKGFKTPKSKGEIGADYGIPFVRFPEWYFCPKCRDFKPIKSWTDDYRAKSKANVINDDPDMVKHMKCPTCHQVLVVTRILTICSHGHIDDFPWVKWVHCCNRGKGIEICQKPRLHFKAGSSATEGLEGLTVTCDCGAVATLKNAFNPNVFMELDEKTSGRFDFHCAGRHPWKNTSSPCGEYPKVVQRGASSVYYPVISSSLVIPPYSDQLGQAVEENARFKLLVQTIEGIPENMRATIINPMIALIAQDLEIEENKIREIVERKLSASGDVDYSTLSVKFRAEEYEALKNPKNQPGEFEGHRQDINGYGIKVLSCVSLIEKIREVQALVGFTRINPAEKSTEKEQTALTVSVKNEKEKYYPACEVRGEGIFIELNSSMIKEWENSTPGLSERVKLINENYSISMAGKSYTRKITAKFLLLHTLAHLLLKQLSFECGYNIASLKERIYCSEADEGKEMSGMLIYTSSGDSEGTLGGLVRQGMRDVFPDIFVKAVRSAYVCSNDPVCSLSNGQGREGLNLAACYACSLLPETSCEEFNILLDRGVVIGTLKNKFLGFFKEPIKVGKSIVQDNKITIKSVGTPQDRFISNWDSFSDWLETDTEIENAKLVKAHLNEYREILGTDIDVSFEIIPGGGAGTSNMAWISKKVMLFSHENHNSLVLAMKTDWKCFDIDSKDFSWRDFLNTISEV